MIWAWHRKNTIFCGDRSHKGKRIVLWTGGMAVTAAVKVHKKTIIDENMGVAG